MTNSVWKVPHPVTHVASMFQLENLLDDILDREINVVIVPRQWLKSGKAISFAINRWTNERSRSVNT